MSAEPEGKEIFCFRASGQASAVFFTLVGAFAWIAVMYLLYVNFWPETGDVGIPLPAAVGIGALGVVANAAALARQLYGKKVVFDGSSRTVSISRLFGEPFVMTFQSIARVAPLTYKDIFSTREAYCLVPTIAPLFGLKIISPICVPGGDRIERFRFNVLPKIEKILELDKTGQKRVYDTKFPAPSCYIARNARYTKSFARRNVIMSAFLAIVILCGISVVPLLKTAGTGEAAVKAAATISAFFTLPAALSLILLLLASVTSISFDTSKNVIELRRGIFGCGGVRRYDMSSAEAFEVMGNGTSLYGNWRREIYLRLDGVTEPVLLMYSASRGKASADELKFLAGLLSLDPTRDMKYTIYQYFSTMFEVP